MMAEYHDVKKARSPLAIGGVAMVAAFGIGFCLINDPIFRIFGGLCLLVVLNGLYSIWKKEEWSLHVAAGVIEWDAPRWRNPKGRVELSTVAKAVIDDGDASVTLHFRDGQQKKIKLIGSGVALHEHFIACYPRLEAEYVEGSHSLS